MDAPANQQKPRQACLGCRRIKVACDNPQDGSTSCKRCVRLSVPCVYTKSQRGRRSDRPRATRSASPPPRSAQQSIVRDHHDRPPPLPMATPTDKSASPSRDARRPANLDVTELLEPAIPAPGSSSPPRRAPAGEVDAGTRRMFEDPVDIGYVTLAEADQLVKFFHGHLNPLIAILDPGLHTLPFLRATSSLLFTTLLVAASKFTLRSTHSVLQSHAESLVNRAANSAECSTALIQALLILVYYKGPTDRTAWLKIGIALRLAYQLRWHEAAPTLSLPSDEGEARRILDAERTWFCLVCFDRQYSSIFNLPTTIKVTDYGDAEAWARAHFHLNIPVDIHLACAIATRHADDFWGRIRKDYSLPRDLVTAILTELYLQHARYRKKWFPRDSPPAPTHLAPARHLMEMFTIAHQLIIKNHLLLLSTPHEAEVLLPECLELAGQLVEALEAVQADGSLTYLHDAGATALSNFGLIMYKLFWRLEPHARTYAIQLTQRARNCCPGEGPLTYSTYTARFFDRVLGLFRNADEEEPAPAPEPASQADLDQFLQIAGGDFGQLLDDDYWGNLFTDLAAFEPAAP